MEFFDKLGKKASEAYKITADKTGKLAKEAKLRLKIGDLKSQINNIYEEIGKKVYQNHVDSSTIDLEKEIEESCTKIDLLSEEIEMKLKECLELRDRKQCPNCFTEMDRDVKFCPECGAKQEVIEETQIAKEVEIIEKEDNMNIQNNVEEQNDINEEDASQDNSIDEIEENNGAERNTEEKNMKENSIDENNMKENSENEQENEDNEHKENLQKTVEVESNIDTDIQVSESENDENK